MDAVIISARRAYDFRIDDLRLSLLSTANVLGYLQEVYGTTVSQIGSPPPLFGDVLQTYPPGVMVGLGTIPIDENTEVALRSLHIEATRIVVDVAGPSSAIDVLFDRLTRGLETLRAPDGAPAIGTPFRTYDSSDIRWPDGPWSLDLLVNPVLLPLLRGHFDDYVTRDQRVSVPSLRLNMPRGAAPYPGQTIRDHEALYIDLRSGTAEDDRVVISTAPLDTEAHLALIAQLGEVLGKRPLEALPEAT